MKADSQGRITIPKDLIELSGITSNVLYLCNLEANCVQVTDHFSSKDQILGSVTMDHKSRFCTRKFSFLKEIPEFVPYVKDKKLYLGFSGKEVRK